MNIPSETQCYRIMAKMAMLPNIVAHSIQVCQVASLLVDGLNPGGRHLNPDLIRAAALLHDITKTRSLSTRERHDGTGADYLQEQGYPEVADTVRQHVRLVGFEANERPTAAEIVNYADKRVMHDKVVSLDERMADLMERYNGSSELDSWLDRMHREARAIEAKLFARLPFSAAELSDHLDPDDFEMKVTKYRKMNAEYTNAPS